MSTMTTTKPLTLKRADSTRTVEAKRRSQELRKIRRNIRENGHR